MIGSSRSPGPSRVVTISVLVIAAAVVLAIASTLTMGATLVSWKPILARFALAFVLPVMLVLDSRTSWKQIVALLLLTVAAAGVLVLSGVVGPVEIMIFVIGLSGIAVHAHHRRTLTDSWER